MGVYMQLLIVFLLCMALSFWIFHNDSPALPQFENDAVKEGMRWHSVMEAHYAGYIHGGASLVSRSASRPALILSPVYSDFFLASTKLATALSASIHPDAAALCLIVYNVEDIEGRNTSMVQVVDNVRLFMEAIKAAPVNDCFFWINVGSGIPERVYSLIPTHLHNVASVKWTYETSPMYSFMETLRMLGGDTLSRVGAIASLSSGVRGPLLQLENGAWLSEYKALLDTSGVGLVGPIIGCEVSPHVQTHMFMLRPVLVQPLLVALEKYYLQRTFVPMEEYFRVRLSQIAHGAGLKIASMLRAKRTTKAYLDRNSECTELFRVRDGETCALDPADVLFMRWGGGDWGEAGYPCSKGVVMDPVTLGRVRGLTRSALRPEDALHRGLIKHEVVSGGLLYDLYREHSAELDQYDAAITQQGTQPGRLQDRQSADSKVCFLVRTAAMHDPKYAASQHSGEDKLSFVEMDLDVLIKCKYLTTMDTLYGAAVR
jgi:hypothetical protein